MYKEFIADKPDYYKKKRYDNTVTFPDGSSVRTVCLFSTIDDNSYATDAQKAGLDDLKERDEFLWGKYRKGIWGTRTNGLVWNRGVHYHVVPREEFERNKRLLNSAYGMDFGGGEEGDPTVVTDVYWSHTSKIILWDEVYCTPIAKETKFKVTYIRENSPSILSGMEGMSRTKPIYADNSWKVNIADINIAGYKIIPCVKNSTVIGTKVQQINMIRAHYTIFIPDDCLGLLNEMENSSWEYLARKDEFSNKLKDGGDHRTIDAGRYPIMTMLHENPSMNEETINSIKAF